MNSIEILEKIISALGDCSDAALEQCRKCPLSRLKVQDNGSSMNCIEAVGATNLPSEQANEKYLDAAIRKLAEIRLEEILEETDGSNQ